ncbi:MAG: hypothetical protein JWN09_7, partial [Microbacteriaceae bacterium]|nr:hypothetical protein [Microbacteriaceae bacterium]
DISPGSFTVSKTTPNGADTVDKGSTVKVNFNGNF